LREVVELSARFGTQQSGNILTILCTLIITFLFFGANAIKEVGEAIKIIGVGITDATQSEIAAISSIIVVAVVGLLSVVATSRLLKKSLALGDKA
jgi:hypothetical protein